MRSPDYCPAGRGVQLCRDVRQVLTPLSSLPPPTRPRPQILTTFLTASTSAPLPSRRCPDPPFPPGPTTCSSLAASHRPRASLTPPPCCGTTQRAVACGTSHYLQRCSHPPERDTAYTSHPPRSRLYAYPFSVTHTFPNVNHQRTSASPSIDAAEVTKHMSDGPVRRLSAFAVRWERSSWRWSSVLPSTGAAPNPKPSALNPQS